MSTGHYHRRWSAGSSASRSTPISSSLTSNVEPSTYGTSWNSVRWNKPNTGTGYRSLSTLASHFEPRTSTKSHYSPSPIGRSTKPSSLGPSVSVRASRFDSTVRDQKDKYRTEARDLIHKWTSRERGSANTVEPSYSSRKLDTASSSPCTSYPYRTSTITPRAHSTSVSRYSSYERPTNSSYTSPSPTPQSHTLKADRPWRQRMAESQRIRATLGDEVSEAYSRHRRASSSRRSSLSQTSDVDDVPMSSALLLRNFGSSTKSNSMNNSNCASSSPSSFSAISTRNREGSSIYGPNSRFTSSFVSNSSYKPSEDTFSTKYMSRSYSPIRSTSDIFKNTPSSRISTQNNALDRQSSLDSLSNRDDNTRDKGVSAVPKNPSIRESSKEKDNEKKRYSSKERTARRNSRQQSLNLETSSSEEDVPTKEETRKQRRKKSKQHLLGVVTKTLPNNENVKLVPGDTVAELTNQLVDLANRDEQLASCPTTPRVTRKPTKANALSRVPSKTQIIKSPSIVEVPGISRSESVSSILSPSFKTAPSEEDKKKILVGDSQDDESQYSAIAHFKPFKPIVKRLAPVPGLWNMNAGEENISKNKCFEREESAGGTFHIMKVNPKETASKKIRSLQNTKRGPKAESGLSKTVDSSETKTRKVLPKKVLKVTEISASKPKEENIVVSKLFSRRSSSECDLKVLKDSNRRNVSLPKIRSVPTLREIEYKKTLNRKASSLNAVKTLKIPQKSKSLICLSCKQPKSHNVQLGEEIVKKEQSSGAQVIVDTPQKGVNMSKIRKKIKLHRKELIAPIVQPENMNVTNACLTSGTTEDIRRSSSRAAEFLDEMRFTEPRMDWNRDDLESSGILILPDKSILEEYVRRKRGRLERLHSEPIQERDESSDRGSPCPSTKSELLPACTARVFNPSSYGHSYITTPSRNHSIEPSSASATPTTGSVMLLDSIQPVSNYNNFNSTPQAFLRANTARIQCARPIQFEAPKSAFEERMQMQANAIRKASINSSASDDFKQSVEHNRRGSDSMNSISSAFEAALAEKQLGVGRHERYAAHIPVLRGDGSGRQSAASVDSSQSGVLETASKQLDQVIDQARHRHHQHRSKFKEAIDYLDQIFEDLKKECEPAEEASAKQPKPANTSLISSTSTTTQPTKKENHSLTKQNVRAVASVGQTNTNNLKTNSLPNRGNRNKLIKPPSPLDVVIAAGITSSNSHKPSKLSEDSAETPTEYAVTETIVLPKKTDKLDFTRRWLHNDLSSLAHNGPVNLVSDSGTYLDDDEHSLGSCSAEVAAINVDKIKKPTKQPQIVLPPSQPTPIRPQPFRPQPGLIGAAGSSNGTRHFPVDIDSHFPSSSSLQRVASFDHMSPEKRSNENHYWRSGSQEPYHTLQSVRSDADCRPSPSAFQALGNRGSSLRASLRSLPDASIVRANSVSRREQQQPPLSIDQLVADLELNTDTQQVLANDKRRSFPTTLEAEVNSLSRNSSQRERITGAGVRTSYHAPPTTQVKSNFTNRNHNFNHKSLDEVTSLLNNVVGDMNNSNIQLRRKQTSMTNNNQLNPFETINQEKINPSRVEAMHNMFERGGGSNKTRNGNVNANSVWKAGPQPFRRIAQQPSSNNNINNNNNNNNNLNLPFEEESYYDIADFAVKPYRKVSPPRQIHQTTVTRKASPSVETTTPAYPSSQPPQFPPSNNNIRNGSATSSTNGGYYSSNSSMAGGNQMTRRSSLVGHQSISSRAPSIDDEDDGFYDNIGVYDDRRCSHGSDMDVASISSRPSGNAKGTRIGSFLRKIGGRTSRPPGSAASLISLNKVANETPMHQGILQKSNSMSSEPWNKQILQANGKGQMSSVPPSAGNKSERGGSNGIGTRLKNSLFGSKKRLNG